MNTIYECANMHADTRTLTHTCSSTATDADTDIDEDIHIRISIHIQVQLQLILRVPNGITAGRTDDYSAGGALRDELLVR